MSAIIQDLCAALAKALVEKTDEMVKEVLAGRMGVLDAQVKLEEMGQHVTCEKHPSGVEIYLLDDTPFFELFPIEVEIKDGKMIASRKYRELK